MFPSKTLRSHLLPHQKAPLTDWHLQFSPKIKPTNHVTPQQEFSSLPIFRPTPPDIQIGRPKYSAHVPIAIKRINPDRLLRQLKNSNLSPLFAVAGRLTSTDPKRSKNKDSSLYPHPEPLLSNQPPFTPHCCRQIQNNTRYNSTIPESAVLISNHNFALRIATFLPVNCKTVTSNL
jgi:hypothetical protein